MMKIVVVDDDKLVALSLKTILESKGIEVLATGSDGDQAAALYDEYIPDVMLMDIRMGKVTGLDAAEKILSRHPDAKILFLTTFADDEYIMKAIEIGAKGYILKQDYDGIESALKSVISGQSVFGSEIITKLPTLMQTRSGFDYESHDIGQKEQEIISLVADGLSNKEIASKLYLSEGTVRNYISAILEKLELRDRTQLAVFYYRNR